VNKLRHFKRYRIYGTVLTALLIGYYYVLPSQLFHDPYSTVLVDANGKLLGATIARDGQWRFPATTSVPDKFAVALTTFEDKRFWYHPGFDPLAFGRAIKQDLRAHAIVSGGSTLTMQLIRLSRKGKPRTVLQKAIEIVLASRLEVGMSKQEILASYASHAPFGGNAVGLEAACWRYFGRDPESLSWAEAAMLAVLPNAPALIHPGRNRDLLRQKRNHLLDRLLATHVIDETTCQLAKAELLPEEPKPLPMLAYHLLQRATKEGGIGTRIQSTIRSSLQERTTQIVEEHVARLEGNQIFNAAAVVAEVATGTVVAYIGNSRTALRGEHGGNVDVVVAPRSTGSILKPFLYAASLDEGKILPRTLLPDIPTLINGFAPKNFSHEYDGAVPADAALIRSLNIPAVHLLQDYRYEKLHDLLQHIGMTTLSQPPDHYGLSLILGGAEANLWDLTGMYASMARTLNKFNRRAGANRYSKSDFHPLRYLLPAESGVDSPGQNLTPDSWISAGAIFSTLDALQAVYRPGEQSGWQYFTNPKRIAWKTGTSFGFRDGWAIGLTPDYVIGVWVGNADGEGRPSLTGTEAAAPIMFDLFDQLQAGSRWFGRPDAELERITVCTRSGFRNGPLCNTTDTVWVVKAGLESPACPYHKRVHLTCDGTYRVNTNCARVDEMVAMNWFVLPPAEAVYYRSKNISYKTLPPFRDDCDGSSPDMMSMQLIYPKHNASLLVPRELDGRPGRAVLQVAHRDPDATVHWHLDGRYVGSTNRVHQLPVHPDSGRHDLLLVDDRGTSLEEQFEVL
jgi:penicillin-binding protein 1C